MLYQTPIFLLLLAVTAILYRLAERRAWRCGVLIVASLTFYAPTGALDSLIFLVVVVGAFFSSVASRKWPRYSRHFLVSGIVLLSLHLFFWKYAPWLVSQVQILIPGFLSGHRLDIALPIGISFFTLQGIAYLIDLIRGESPFIPFWDFLLFKSFFAQLVAGPIVRAHELFPQLKRLKTPDSADLSDGIALFAMGFFKKMVLAERAGQVADAAFSAPSAYQRSALFFALLAYTVQIWSDFSGYTDMGRGAARILGIRLPENFLSPYFAKTPSEFWKRWHISLSQWIRDYLYVPLIKKVKSKSALWSGGTVLLVMSISGFWHGANWTFLLWGWYHGTLLVIERVFTRFPITLFQRLSSFLRDVSLRVATGLAVIFGWLIFRSNSLGSLGTYLECLIHPGGSSPLPRREVAVLFAACLLIQAFLFVDLETGERAVLKSFRRLADIRPQWQTGFVLGCGTALVLWLILLTLPMTEFHSFIYFQF